MTGQHCTCIVPGPGQDLDEPDWNIIDMCTMQNGYRMYLCHGGWRRKPYEMANKSFCWLNQMFSWALLVVQQFICSAARLQDTKAAREVHVLQDFYDMLSSDSSRAFYGPGHVTAAHQLGAIAVLLVKARALTDTIPSVHEAALFGQNRLVLQKLSVQYQRHAVASLPEMHAVLERRDS